MSAPTTFRRSPRALWRLVGGEVLLADAAGPDVNCLSAPASAAWLLLDRPRTREELSNELASAFGGSSPRIRDHVERLLDQLRERGWVISDDERD